MFPDLLDTLWQSGQEEIEQVFWLVRLCGWAVQVLAKGYIHSSAFNKQLLAQVLQSTLSTIGFKEFELLSD